MRPKSEQRIALITGAVDVDDALANVMPSVRDAAVLWAAWISDPSEAMVNGLRKEAHWLSGALRLRHVLSCVEEEWATAEELAEEAVAPLLEFQRAILTLNKDGLLERRRNAQGAVQWRQLRPLAKILQARKLKTSPADRLVAGLFDDPGVALTLDEAVALSGYSRTTVNTSVRVLLNHGIIRKAAHRLDPGTRCLRQPYCRNLAKYNKN